ncbi:MAG: hypothetical protein HUU35_10210, partial [Armatimonadetes bacterium]|nr:hypothetical protein [Armatimonadota bacterium]
MRIGLLCNNFQPRHGWATLAVDLGRALVELGVEVVALCATDDGPPQGWDPTDRRAVLPSLAGRAL